jgi:hypothetical protein
LIFACLITCLFAASQTVKKVIEINKYLLGTMAGGAADCQFWQRNLGTQVCVGIDMCSANLGTQVCVGIDMCSANLGTQVCVGIDMCSANLGTQVCVGIDMCSATGWLM